MSQKPNPNGPAAPPAGGLHLAWLLADDPRTITTKDGAKRTVVELRDPRRLSQSLVLWLGGEVGSLAGVQPGALIQLHVEKVRAGRSRGELVGEVRREVVEAAFTHARGGQQ
jgi:hypothetical protein